MKRCKVSSVLQSSCDSYCVSSACHAADFDFCDAIWIQNLYKSKEKRRRIDRVPIGKSHCRERSPCPHTEVHHQHRRAFELLNWQHHSTSQSNFGQEGRNMRRLYVEWLDVAVLQMDAAVLRLPRQCRTHGRFFAAGSGFANHLGADRCI